MDGYNHTVGVYGARLVLVDNVTDCGNRTIFYAVAGLTLASAEKDDCEGQDHSSHWVSERPVLCRSVNASWRRSTMPSSALRSQARGSYCFLYGVPSVGSI
jgi:hypothetical protein